MKPRRKHGRSGGGFLPVILRFALLAMTATGCGNTNQSPSPSPVAPSPAETSSLTAAEVKSIAETAAASVNVPLVIAVTDRSGSVLAVYKKASAPASAVSNFGTIAASDDVAVALARSTAFFSSDQGPVSTRTIRFLSASHFAPGTSFAPSGPLFGIENTNRGCRLNVAFLPGQSLPVPTSLSGKTGLGIITGKPDELDSDNLAVNPGGVPIYKNGALAGGIGVVGPDPATAEFAAVAATLANGFAPVLPAPGAVVVGGFTLPFVSQTTRPAGESAGSADGSYEFAPQASSGPPPEGDLIAETGSTQGGLTLPQVQTIVKNTVATASLTGAVLRLPIGSRTRNVIAVADLDGSLLALYRMHDAPIFSADVAAAKARNSVYFSTVSGELAGVPAGTAVTTRTVGFASQPFFPSGIDGTAPGPFVDLFHNDLINPCTLGHQPRSPNQNGMIFFPGSVPLFLNGKIVGGLGVSGDGVDEDDWTAAGGAAGFDAPDSIRADRVVVRDVRLPYLKFPPHPEN